MNLRMAGKRLRTPRKPGFRLRPVPTLTGMLIFLSTFLLPGAWAATITASSCSQTAVQNAINSANSGDTVVIAATAHPCTITGDVTITQGITFNGGGDTSMIANINVTPTTLASTRITGFLFDANTSRITVGTQSNLVSPTVKPFRIDHNQWGTSSLNGPSGVDIEIWGRAGLTALIDNNTIYAGSAGNGALSSYGPEPIHNFGGVNHCPPGNCGDTWQDQTSWHTPLTPGSGNAIYIEHNTINDVMTSVNGCSWVEAYSGSVTVARYNNITNCAFDEHGTAGMVGARWWELYENTYYIPSSGFAYSDIRAGSGLIFHNHMAPGSKTGAPFQIREEDTSETYAACYQIGRGFDPTPSGSSVNPGWQSCTKDDPSYFGTSVNPEYFSPVYFWGNDSGMENAISITSGSIVLGRDILCWDGTQWSGTCGNTGDPSQVLIHRCQDGTEAGCSATTTSTATYPYTPFTYPYPLDANGLPNPTAGATRPAPPTNLAATVQ